MVRVAVIGIGNMGKAHALCIGRNQIKGLELVAVCDTVHERTVPVTEEFQSVKAYYDWEELIHSNDVDAVIIATPHPLHGEIAIAAMEAGKHILTEKPMDIKLSTASRVNEVAKKTGKVFAIMFNQRTNELYQKAKEIVHSGELGELKRSVWIITNWYRTQHYYNSGEWRATWRGEGGGVLLNQAPHNLDLWQWICGMPCEITAFCDTAKFHQIEVEDDVTIFARYPNGATGTFITSTGEYPGTNRLEISGTRGKLVLENGSLKWWKLSVSEREICKYAKESNPNLDVQLLEYRQTQPDTAHRGILQNFANAILYGEALIAPGVEGVRELTISNAAYLSSWEGNVPIALPFETTRFDAKLDELRKHSHLKISSHVDAGETGYSDRWQVKW